MGPGGRARGHPRDQEVWGCSAQWRSAVRGEHAAERRRTRGLRGAAGDWRPGRDLEQRGGNLESCRRRRGEGFARGREQPGHTVALHRVGRLRPAFWALPAASSSWLSWVQDRGKSGRSGKGKRTTSYTHVLTRVRAHTHKRLHSHRTSTLPPCSSWSQLLRERGAHGDLWVRARTFLQLFRGRGRGRGPGGAMTKNSLSALGAPVQMA